MPEVTDSAIIRARLELDRVWAAFSLADLEPVHAAHASWFGPADGTALVLVYGAFDPPIVFCQGTPSDVDAVLSEPEVAGRTAQAHLNVLPTLLPTARRQFPLFDARLMVRMVLHHDRFTATSRPGVERLGPGHLDELQALYADDRPAFFVSTQLQDGVYFGARDDGALVAVAGTHVVSSRYGVAALGNVYTRAECRRRGLATDVTTAVTAELQRLGASTIVLNIVASNEAARRVYERIGFREYCTYYEGVGLRGPNYQIVKS